jgi:hypothetical protein
VLNCIIGGIINNELERLGQTKVIFYRFLRIERDLKDMIRYPNCILHFNIVSKPMVGFSGAAPAVAKYFGVAVLFGQVGVEGALGRVAPAAGLAEVRLHELVFR